MIKSKNVKVVLHKNGDASVYHYVIPTPSPEIIKLDFKLEMGILEMCKVINNREEKEHAN